MKEQVLTALKARAGNFVSGQALSEQMGVSRTAVWKDIRQLAAAGYEIETDAKRGYRLVNSPDLLTREELLPGPHTQALGQRVLHFATIGSTSSEARARAEAGAPEGTLVVAEEQTQGRGCAGKHWVSGTGLGIWVSLILRPQTPMTTLPCLTMAACAAVGQAVERCGAPVVYKWPNDLFLSGGKAAGILTECSGEPERMDYAILGIGLNVNQSAADFTGLPASAASLKTATGRAYARRELLCDILETLEPLYQTYCQTGRCSPAFDFCRARLPALGRLTLPPDGRPLRAAALREDGRLAATRADGREDVFAQGEVSLRLTMPCKDGN